MLKRIWSDSLKNPFMLFLIFLTVLWILQRRWTLTVMIGIMALIAWYITYGDVENGRR